LKLHVIKRRKDMTAITLSTLSEATEQEVFNQICLHLLTQNERCVNTEIGEDKYCVYKNEGGSKCAAGCLIADDEYSCVMEHRAWYSLVNTGLVPDTHMALIAHMQRIHDEEVPSDWQKKLRSLAESQELSFNEIPSQNPCKSMGEV
jgi:hypothetical protein